MEVFLEIIPRNDGDNPATQTLYSMLIAFVWSKKFTEILKFYQLKLIKLS